MNSLANRHASERTVIMIRAGLYSISVVVGLILTPTAAHAVNHFLNAGELDWDLGTSWNTGTVPNLATDATVRAYVSGNTRTAIVQSAVPDQNLVFAENGGKIKVTTGGEIEVFNHTNLSTGGELIIEGDGIYKATSRLYFGRFASTATLTMTGGSLTTSNVLVVGDGEESEGVASISGGTWTINGGDRLRLADAASSAQGTINLSGSGKIINSRAQNANNNQLTIGHTGSGIFNQTGGEYRASGTTNGLRLSEVVGSAGTYSISGGVLDLRSSANASVTAGLGTARFEVNGLWDVAGVTNEIDIGGNLLLNTATSTLAFNLSPLGIEEIIVGGNADLSNATLEIGSFGGGPTSGLFNLLSAGGTLTTTGLSLESNLPLGWSVSEWGVTGASSNTLYVVIVPEPSGTLLMLLGGSLLVWRGRKRAARAVDRRAACLALLSGLGVMCFRSAAQVGQS